MKRLRLLAMCFLFAVCFVTFKDVNERDSGHLRKSGQQWDK
jgi:hypothetical protein